MLIWSLKWEWDGRNTLVHMGQTPIDHFGGKVTTLELFRASVLPKK